MSILVSAGKQIVHKCGYVPLALTMIGRVLRYRKKDKDEWFSFLEKEFAEVVSIDTDDENLMQVLKVSYNDLPLALKHCFSYCSIFPEDYDFDKDELVRMWIAQGFIESHATESLEEVGDDYFFHMVDRCFFQEVEEDEPLFDVAGYTYKMHDFLHDLAIQVAELESKSIVDKDLRDMVEKSTTLRHSSLTCSRTTSFDYSNLSSLSKFLRTLVFFDEKYLQTVSLNLVLDRFRKLRTLVFSYTKFETLPDIFGGLIHLRYLDLSENSNLTALPNSIYKLYHLQTLLLTGCFSLVKLPSNLGKLVSLRHLFLGGCDRLHSMPSAFKKLNTLVSLDRFIVHPDHGGLRCLGRLDELCGQLKLELPMNRWVDCVEDARKANVQSKCKLSGVSIECSNGVAKGKLSGEERKAILEELRPHANLQYLRIESCIGDKLPSWFSSLSNVSNT